MQRVALFILISLFAVACAEESDSKNEYQRLNESEVVADSVAIQPIDLNNTLFMIHFETAQQLDSLFYASPEKMQGIYDELIFYIDLKVQDLQLMQFQFEGADHFISSALALMQQYALLMRKDFPEVLKILQSGANSEGDKQKINDFEAKFDQKIQPLAKSFFDAQDKFAALHKIELVEY